MKTRGRLLMLVILIAAFAACAGPAPSAVTPSADMPSCRDSRAEFCQVANTGQVCFQPCTDCRRFQVIIESDWWGSSSCTHILSQSGTISVDEKDRSLRFETRYVLKLDDRGPTPITCTADGAPLPPVHLGLGVTDLRYMIDQPAGPYTVWLGDRRIGDIVLPGAGEDLDTPVCLPPAPTPTPSPTYPGPTQTPNPFESPLRTPPGTG